MKNIYCFDFYKHKYNKELLIDVVSLGYTKTFISKRPSHTLSYFDITLITEGEGTFCIDHLKHQAKPQDIIFTRPGEIRTWDKDNIREGLALIFEEEFLQSFFNDQNFLWNLSFFRKESPSAKLSLENDSYTCIFRLFSEIRHEIEHFQDKNTHLLRALLYETLIQLDRLYANTTFLGERKTIRNTSLYVKRFVELVEQSFKQDHSIQSYADQLCITPNYLNEIVRDALAVNAKRYIMNKIVMEAKRLLTYTDLTVAEIADSLGYETPSYFIRLFREQTGTTPLNYRNSSKP